MGPGTAVPFFVSVILLYIPVNVRVTELDFMVMFDVDIMAFDVM
jgi:hypothetical protein